MSVAEEKRATPPTWRELHPGEDPRIEAMQFAWFGSAEPWQKMRAMRGLTLAARRLALLGLQERHPGAGEEELRRRLADLLLGPDLARQAFGAMPESDRDES